ncbi:MAG: sigma-70 family RNA polymerase sigma factor [Myxococcaceae bacterium]|nr:sigma-70 family RNA polymerase sigma factor [Myxococcaceae bacterium]
MSSNDTRFEKYLRDTGLDTADVNTTDLRLAWECQQQDPAALAELDRRVRAVCAGLSKKKGLEVSDLDELCQRVRERVLVGGPKARIAAYKGKGALVKWLQAVAASVAIDASREVKARREDDGEDELLELKATGDSAEARLLQARDKRAFSAAFKTALGELPPRDRTVMRMRFVDQANLDDIAKTYGVHRTSVMRWLESSQERVMRRTRELLGASLKLSTGELDSLLRGLELSFSDRVSRLFTKTNQG